MKPLDLFANATRPAAVGYLLAASLLSAPLAAAAQAVAPWPSKPITLVVTYPPGGGADAMARLIAPKLGEALGQNVIVENKPGAGGQIGASAVAKAVPDRHTLMLDASSFAVNPSLYPKLPYDSDKAFRTVGAGTRPRRLHLHRQRRPKSTVHRGARCHADRPRRRVRQRGRPDRLRQEHAAERRGQPADLLRDVARIAVGAAGQDAGVDLDGTAAIESVAVQRFLGA